MNIAGGENEPGSGILTGIAFRLWPELKEMNVQRRLSGVGEVIITLLTLPLAILGITWLLFATDWLVIKQYWSVLLLFGASLLLFTRLNYFFIIEIRADRYGSAEGSLDSMVQWAAALIFGPSALWLTVLTRTVNFIWNWRKPQSKAVRWSQIRSLMQDLSVATVAYLVALIAYEWLGGVYPLPELSLRVAIPVLLAMLVQFMVLLVIWLPYIAYSIWAQVKLTRSTDIAPLIRLLVLALGLPFLAHPFALFIAGLYVEDGLMIVLFFLSGLLLVAYLGRQLSWTAETSRQQSRQLEKLEALGRDIINAPPDASTLPAILAAHLPAMFPSGRVSVWLGSEGFIFTNPPEWTPQIESIWSWINTKSTALAFLANEHLPWHNSATQHDPLVLAPILSVDGAHPIGCIYIELHSLAQPWDMRALTNLHPAVKSLADSIASALFQAEMYTDALDYQTALQELEFAGRIQSSFLPNELPPLDGWEIAVSFMPARETAGDFFDFITLPEDSVGFVIADVADKGLGAALYMALSRTLIRTYALEYEASPDIVFFSSNERILQDARANLFVTAFYGILDRQTGLLTYSNAGHCSPLLLSHKNGGSLQALTPTGMPIGIDDDTLWSQEEIQIEPGDILVLYTDGILDAQDRQGEFFTERRLIDVIQGRLEAHAQEIQSAIIDAVQDFAEGASQFDDITLLVLKRDLQPIKQLEGSVQERPPV